MTVIAAVNETALAVFAVVVGVTMVITYFASKRCPRPPTSGPRAAA